MAKAKRPNPFAKLSASTAAPKHDADQPVRVGQNWRHRYGVITNVAFTPWQLELWCWRHRIATGMDPYYHLRRASEILFPDSKWHPWREERFRALCDEENCYKLGGIKIWNQSWCGPAASAKTYDAAMFSFLFWLSDPEHSYVVLTSTSKTKMRQRAWPVIQECYISTRTAMDEAHLIGPHMLNSTMELQAQKGDSKHAIFGQAVESGEVAKAVENLRGVHADRIVCLIDEADGTPEAIYSTIPNMLKGCSEFVLINSANGPWTHLDSFSKICTPVKGWGSVTVDTPQWRTKAVPEFQLPPGLCLHFDGKRSPNVVAGKTLYPFLYTLENWKRVENNPDAQRTAVFWSQDRGFWPPEGFSNTVLTEELIEQGNARGKIEFDGKTIPCGSIDTGFGGDACILRYGQLGTLKGGKLALQITECLEIPILVDEVDSKGKKVPAEYQITRRVLDESRKRNVKPEYFGVEATGTGRGVAAMLTQEWGEIVWVESGGKPSDMPASEEDDRPAKDVYDRRVTELWFSVQAFVKGSQIGGFCDDDVIQFCSRTYEFEGKKYKIEKKDELKERLGRSPDNADSVAVLVEVARRHGMATAGPRQERLWNTVRNQIDLNLRLVDEDRMYAPEEAPWDNDEAPTYEPA